MSLAGWDRNRFLNESDKGTIGLSWRLTKTEHSFFIPRCIDLKQWNCTHFPRFPLLWNAAVKCPEARIQSNGEEGHKCWVKQVFFSKRAKCWPRDMSEKIKVTLANFQRSISMNSQFPQYNTHFPLTGRAHDITRISTLTKQGSYTHTTPPHHVG